MSPIDPVTSSSPVILTRLSLSESLQKLADESGQHGISVRRLMKHLAGRGYPAFMAVVSFPFCLPIPIPGVSVPFGLMLAFAGFRMALGRKLWLPRWIQKKELPPATVVGMLGKGSRISRRIEKCLKPRWPILCAHPFLHRIHGVTMAACGLLLAVPLPLFGSNFIFALPLFCIALALLENDSLFLFLGYFLWLLSLLFVVLLILLGQEGVRKLMTVWT